MDDWKFKDPKNLAVISTRRIFRGGGWIAYVSHDVEDESWQFYGNEPEVDHDDLILVGLIEVVELDESVAQLADLPLGWHAWRDTKTSPWKRGKMPPELPEPTN
ncbi:hypothetical protein LB515_21745 [Mesorhizobium sp. CA15]|uniref:hypothetical protein n=1 Tax=Mesorhizobium sp. CA15 TaxID=2876641 RepID=UPI001CD127F7|nr:hypothetical protein [Mesorhizobium sp. CA15]MBZ9868006.1 hypothetical protein [Mesorhizobium sp. CA15]